MFSNSKTNYHIVKFVYLFIVVNKNKYVHALIFEGIGRGISFLSVGIFSGPHNVTGGEPIAETFL